jgi:hypothetical protein
MFTHNHKRADTLRRRGIRIFIALLVLLAAPALAQSVFDVNWWTTDGGGQSSSIGGGFELGGTIGQPDAGTTTSVGGSFQLVGGFWAAPPCWCLSDINNDGARDGRDVQGFVDCITAGGSNCACADVLTDGVLDMADVAVFVSGLVAGGACP